MEAQRSETGFLVLLLTGEERLALERVLRVVEDNWWLDDLERSLLERLQGSDTAAAAPAA